MPVTSTAAFLCFFPNVAFNLAFDVVVQSELRGVGLGWAQLTDKNSRSGLSIFFIWCISAVSILTSILINWYMDEINPGEYGVHKPYNFPFKRWYWFGHLQDPDEYRDEVKDILTDESNEALPKDAVVGIRIRHLRKLYDTRVAVNDVSLDILEDQITALLGHNGAGKSSTMSMLTGFLPCTSGEIIVDGFNLHNNIKEIRKLIGLCPQHDVFFPNLNVREHIHFFAKLKGCDSSIIHGEVDEMLEILGLTHEMESLPAKLSNGMMRKLSLGIALIGGSKIVILDEPTSGMDPESRRATWDIIQEQRSGRTMLLVTQFMDEADYLGDRIAILAGGNIVCSGTSLFLKHKYGCGYYVTMVKSPECDVNGVDQLIKKLVPTARLHTNEDSELSYNIQRRHSDLFPQLFNQIDQKKLQLGIQSYGVSVTTLDEVFLMVGRIVGAEGADELSDEVAFEIVYEKKNERNTGYRLLVQQFYAMFLKKVIYTKRVYTVTIGRILVPIVFAFIACVPLVINIVRGEEVSYQSNVTMLMSVPHVDIGFENYEQPLVVLNQEKEIETKLNRAITLSVQAQNIPYEIKSSSSETPFSTPIDQSSDIDEKANNIVFVITHHACLRNSSNTFPENITNLHIYFPGKSKHFLSMAVNLVGNTMLYLFTNTSHHSNIDVSYQILPDVLLPSGSQDRQQLALNLVLVTLNFALSLLLATFVVSIVYERLTDAKHCQFVSGVHAETYWMSSFAWDFIQYMIPVFCIILLYWSFGIEAYSDYIGLCLLLMVLYGLSGIPFVYMLSYWFINRAVAYAAVSTILNGSFFGLLIDIFSLTEFTNPLYLLLSWTLYITHPGFCFSTAIENIKHCYKEQICWSQAELIMPMGLMFMQFIVYFVVLFAIEYELWKKLKFKFWDSVVSNSKLKKVASTSFYRLKMPVSDDDVEKEDKKVQMLMEKLDTCKEEVVLSRVSKYYDDHAAVNRLSLAIHKGECFGLLGVIGSGKTTLFKVLTGSEEISEGSVYINNHNILTSVKRVQQSIGYCPESDAQLHHMTVEETLYMFARLRGMLNTDIPYVVRSLCRLLSLEEVKDELAGTLSGGNNRKLSTAMALIGDPPIIFMDEPTAGMDPVSRNHVWTTLKRIQKSGRTIVLTTDSMEECEALCTRITIMVNGRLKCLGSCQYLKSKFGQGYSLMAKVSPGSNIEETRQWTDKLVDYIEDIFDDCNQEYCYHGLILYQIFETDEEELTWGELFERIEGIKDDYHIDDYSIGQTTLEQVFLNFARLSKIKAIHSRHHHRKKGHKRHPHKEPYMTKSFYLV